MMTEEGDEKNPIEVVEYISHFHVESIHTISNNVITPELSRRQPRKALYQDNEPKASRNKELKT